MILPIDYYYVYNILSILKDNFDVDDAAPIASPRDIGGGNNFIVNADSANNGEISGGELVLSGVATNNFVDPAYHWEKSNGDGWEPVDGLVIAFGKIRSTNINRIVVLGADDATPVGTIQYKIYFVSGGVLVIRTDTGDVSSIGTWAINIDYQIAIVFFDEEIYYFFNDSINWKLLWIDSSTFLPEIFPCIVGAGNMDWTIDNARIARIPTTPLSPEIEITVASSGDGSVSGNYPKLHDADFYMNFDLDTLGVSPIIIQFRYRDSLNYWRVQLFTGGEIFLNEVVNGASFVRGSTAAVLSGGEKLTIISDGNTISVRYGNTLAFNYSSAISFLRETDWSIASLGGDGVISNLEIRKLYARNESGLGSELVVNGTNPTNTSGWTPNGTPSTFEAIGGRFHIITDAINEGMLQSVPIEVGKYYLFSFDYEVVTDVLDAWFDTSISKVFENLTGTGTASIYMEAIDNTATMLFRADNSGAEFYINNISIREIEFFPHSLGNTLSKVVQ